MSEDTTNLVLDPLRAMRATLTRLENKVDTLAAEMLAMRRHQQGNDSLLNNDHTELAAVKARLDRIERRLDSWIDGAAA